MKSLVIAEDNLSTLAVLSHEIDWASSDIVVTGMFENGSDALEFCLTESPDALLVDIRLPGLDGLSMVNRLRASGVNPVVVVISAHSDFELAQTAIRNSVHDYLLKPIDYALVRESVASGLRKAGDGRARELTAARHRTLVADRNLLDFLAGAISSEQFESESTAVGARAPLFPAAVVVIRVDGSDAVVHVLESLESTSRSVLGAEAFVTVDPVAATVIAIVPSVVGETAMADLRRRTEVLIKSGPASMRRSVYAAIGPTAEELQALPASFQRAMSCAASTFGFDESHVEAWYDSDCVTDYEAHRSWEDGLVAAALAGSREGADDALRRLRGRIARGPRERASMLALTLGTVTRVERRLHRWLDVSSANDSDALTAGITTARSMAMLVDATIDALTALVEPVVRACETSSLRLVRTVDETILRELANPGLTVAMIAERVGYTPSYLTRLYRHETGRGVLAAINERRIALAKDLLVKTDATVAEIADRAGCRSAAYFSTLFRRGTGLSPTEFRESPQT